MSKMQLLLFLWFVTSFAGIGFAEAGETGKDFVDKIMTYYENLQENQESHFTHESAIPKHKCKWPYVWTENGFCFLFVNSTEPVNWYMARNECLFNHKGTLAIIDTKEKHDTLFQLMNQLYLVSDDYFWENDYWIDGSDNGSEGEFYWVRTGAKFTYTNWEKNEPNNLRTENCVLFRLKEDLPWNDMTCDGKLRGIICEPKYC